ncbi:MAG: hypothetical protein HY017_33250 [Betaproteobacteria bacterium]|nr:hypothetical protein [Betaproteobacteria bacterium]
MATRLPRHLAAGALETWIAYPQSKRFEFFAHSGALQQSRFALDFSGLFD